MSQFTRILKLVFKMRMFNELMIHGFSQTEMSMIGFHESEFVLMKYHSA